MAIIYFCSWSRFCEYPMFWITWKVYSDTTNHRAQGREPLHYIILMKANVYLKIPLSALNIESVTVSHVYSCAAGRSTAAECNSAKHELRKGNGCGVRCACSVEQDLRAWAQRWGAGKSAGAWLHHWTVYSSPQGWYEPFCITSPKGDTKRVF